MHLPLSESSLPLSMKWRHGKSMPHFVNYCPEAVVINAKVYVGAGCSMGNDYKTVAVYNIDGDEWSVLPKYNYYWFSMTSIKKQLVLVGGVFQDSEDRTNQLGVWDEEGQLWSNNLPPMPTPRSGASVVTYKDRWMIVAGGFNTESTSTVEVLDILTGYWHHASVLPIQQYKMSSTVIGNMWYLLGGYPGIFQAFEKTRCIFVCIEDLIHQAVFQISSTSPWRSLPDTPFAKSTALSLNGALLAVGGSNCSSIHLYKPSSNSWVEAGELLTVRQGCACTLLPSGEIFIVGGDKVLFSSSNEVEIGYLEI